MTDDEVWTKEREVIISYRWVHLDTIESMTAESAAAEAKRKLVADGTLTQSVLDWLERDYLVSEWSVMVDGKFIEGKEAQA